MRRRAAPPNTFPSSVISLLLGLWRPRIRRQLSCQRLQKFHEIGALLAGEFDLFDLFIEIGIRISAARVEVNDILQRFEAAVVHIGGAIGDVAERWSSERAVVGI